MYIPLHRQNDRTSNNIKHINSMKAKKEKTMYTVAPYNEFWQGIFNRVKEFKSKKTAFKYANELIKEGYKQVNINIDYFLGADLVKYETASYDGKKLDIYESFS